MYGIRILDGYVVEGEVLVERFDLIENREADSADTISGVSIK
jgi:hypothetical protein